MCSSTNSFLIWTAFVSSVFSKACRCVERVKFPLYPCTVRDPSGLSGLVWVWKKKGVGIAYSRRWKKNLQPAVLQPAGEFPWLPFGLHCVFLEEWKQRFFNLGSNFFGSLALVALEAGQSLVRLDFSVLRAFWQSSIAVRQYCQHCVNRCSTSAVTMSSFKRSRSSVIYAGEVKIFDMVARHTSRQTQHNLRRVYAGHCYATTLVLDRHTVSPMKAFAESTNFPATGNET